jgi:hypothetical protein
VAEGAWGVHVVPLKTRTVPVAVDATHDTDEVHVTPTTSSPVGPVLVHVAPL